MHILLMKYQNFTAIKDTFSDSQPLISPDLPPRRDQEIRVLA
jgi:hypothetical protein